METSLALWQEARPKRRCAAGSEHSGIAKIAQVAECSGGNEEAHSHLSLRSADAAVEGKREKTSSSFVALSRREAKLIQHRTSEMWARKWHKLVELTVVFAMSCMCRVFIDLMRCYSASKF